MKDSFPSEIMSISNILKSCHVLNLVINSNRSERQEMVSRPLTISCPTYVSV